MHVSQLYYLKLLENYILTTDIEVTAIVLTMSTTSISCGIACYCGITTFCTRPEHTVLYFILHCMTVEWVDAWEITGGC